MAANIVDAYFPQASGSDKDIDVNEVDIASSSSKDDSSDNRSEILELDVPAQPQSSK